MPSEGLGAMLLGVCLLKGFLSSPHSGPILDSGRGTNCVSGPRWLLERVTSPACASVVSSVEWG